MVQAMEELVVVAMIFANTGASSLSTQQSYMHQVSVTIVYSTEPTYGLHVPQFEGPVRVHSVISIDSQSDHGHQVPIHKV